MRIFTLALIGTAVMVTGCKDGGQSAPQSQPTVEKVAVPAIEAAKKPAKLTSWDGPLGLKRGLTAGELGESIPLKDEGGMVYSSDTAPHPNARFEKYFYTISDTHGLCRVMAASKDINTNQFGEQLKSEFSSLESALIEKYNKPSLDMKYLQSGSLWDDDKYWMMGLMKQDRTHKSAWYSKSITDAVKGTPKNYATLPETIESISLEAVAPGTEKGYMRLAYTFDNNDLCADESKKAKNKSL